MKIIFKLFFFVFLCLFLSTVLHAQKKLGKALVDSLLAELPKAKEDTNKVNMLKKISYTLSSYNTKEGILYGNKGLELTTKLGWKKGLAGMNLILGCNYLQSRDYKSALEYFNKALKISDEIGNKKDMASAMGNIGNVYLYQSNYPGALEYFSKALKINEDIGNKVSIAYGMEGIGAIYYHEGNFLKALEYDLKALKVYEDIGNKERTAIITTSIGNIYTNQNNYTKALEYYLKGLKISEDIGDKMSIASAIGNIGIIYEAQSNYPKALEYQFKALKMNEDMGNKQNIPVALEHIGTVYLDQHNHTKALEYYLKALKMNEDMGNKQGIENINFHIGVNYSRMKQYAMAIKYEQKALKMALEINELDDVRDYYHKLSDAYDSTGDYKKALYYSNKYHELEDSIFSKNNGQKIVRLEMQSQYDKQHLADSLKAAEKEQLAALNLQRQRNYTYAGIVGVVLLLGFSFFIFRERRKSEKLLLNILPSVVAKELKEKGYSDARNFEEVTVLFTDFVSFTKVSMRLTPQALVNELDTCFKAFDNIMGKHNIEKIKTVGDAYLAVCGLPKADHLHATNVVNAALEIRDFMQKRNEELGENTFAIRLGIHSGNVVAGIVGVKKFAYDIWGDTVNTAARMEQNSEAGKINISETTYELVKDKFTCTYRGEIEAKNKGMLKMYFVG